jgi:DNA-directed RNA polymerase specialized sigma24 family protein
VSITEQGHFSQLNDRDDLWRLLVAITIRKTCNLNKHENRQSRGAGRLRSHSDVAEYGADELAGAGPFPELVAQFTEECRRLLGLLRDESFRSVALWRLEGYPNEEISARFGYVQYTVDPKLRALRQLCEGERRG